VMVGSAVFVVAAVTTLAGGGISGDSLGIGLMDCTTSHPQLLSKWRYNSTLAALVSTSKSESAAADAMCLGVIPSSTSLPSGLGVGVSLTSCPKYDPHEANFSSEATYWNFSSGQLESLWAGDPRIAGTSGTRGLCLNHAESGVIEMADCGKSSLWTIDAQSGELSPGRTRKSCLVAIDTPPNVQHPWSKSAGNCSTRPHSLLPYCDVTRPLEERIDNIMSFSYIDDMPVHFSRLGFPKPPVGECLHGFATECVDSETCATTFPNGLASASSFNNTLFELIGQAISTEGRAVDNIAKNNKDLGGSDELNAHQICWSPDINPFRHPLWGRGQEVPSEDPLLCGKYGAHYVKGLQGAGDPAGKGFLRMVASPKHFLGYDLEGMGPGMVMGHTLSGPTFMRHNFSSRMSAQEMVEYYAKPFKITIEEGGAMGIMCSYNAVEVTAETADGKVRSTGSIPACAFTALQDGMMRGQWNFSGQVVSDCGAVSDFLVKNDCSGCEGQFPNMPKGFNDLWPTHGLCNDTDYTSKCPGCESKCIAAKHLNGGTDTVCGGAGDVVGAVAEGQVSKVTMVSSSRRVLRQLMSLGINVPKADEPYTKLGKADIDSKATRQLNLEAARQGIVLLKNDAVAAGAKDKTQERLLPLRAGQSVAVIGPIATTTGGLLSNYHPEPPPKNSTHSIVSPLQALLDAGVNATWRPGSSIGHHSSNPNMLDQAAELAAASDVAVVMVGLDASQEGEHRDRNATGHGLTLPGDQEELVRRVQQANGRTVVVLVHGGPVAIDFAKEEVPAILTAHYPGLMGGIAIADVLTGKYNPSGRLTHTFYPAGYAKRSIFATALRQGGGQTYMHYDPASYGEVLWEFGYGLSYANFTQAAAAGQHVKVTATTAVLAAAPLKFQVEVTNNGGPDGAFSALGFIKSTHAEAPRNKRLFGYDRAANIAAKKTATLTVELSGATAALVKTDGSSVLMPGSYELSVADVAFSLELTGPPVVLAPAPPLFD